MFMSLYCKSKGHISRDKTDFIQTLSSNLPSSTFTYNTFYITPPSPYLYHHPGAVLLAGFLEGLQVGFFHHLILLAIFFVLSGQTVISKSACAFIIFKENLSRQNHTTCKNHSYCVNCYFPTSPQISPNMENPYPHSIFFTEHGEFTLIIC